MPIETLPLSTGQFSNVDERSLRDRNALAINVMLDERGGIMSRPGMKTFTTFFPESGHAVATAAVELLYPYRQWIVAVLNDGRVFTIDEGGTQVERSGERVRGEYLPSAITDQDESLLIAGGATPIVWAGSGLTKPLTTSGFVPRPTHLAVVQRYLVGNDAGNDDIYYTTTTDHTAWDPGLRVFQAESRRDPVVAILSAANFLYFFGTETIDVYYPTNSANPAFSRTHTLPRGIVGARACLEVDGTIYFMDTNRRICRLNDRNPEVISFEIEKSLLSLPLADDCVAHRMDFEGRHLLVWHFPKAGTAFAYDYATSAQGAGKWYEWKSWSESLGAYAAMPMAAYAYHPTWRRHFCASTSRVYELSLDAGDDEGTEIRRVIRSGFINHGSFMAKRSNVFRQRATRGTSTDLTTDPVVMVRIRDEDMFWREPMHLSLGMTGATGTLGAEWRGAGIYRERQWELMCSANVPRLILYPPEEDFDVLMR